MSTYIAVCVSYPERGDYNWHEALASYAEVGCVEVAFYRPELFLQRVTMEKVLAPFSWLPLRVTSVHMAQARITEFDTFIKVLRKTILIAQGLDCSLIVVHPTNARLEEVEGKITASVDPLLAQAGVTLCWETFSGRRRFLSGIEGIGPSAVDSSTTPPATTWPTCINPRPRCWPTSGSIAIASAASTCPIGEQGGNNNTCRCATHRGLSTLRRSSPPSWRAIWRGR